MTTHLTPEAAHQRNLAAGFTLDAAQLDVIAQLGDLQRRLTEAGALANGSRWRRPFRRVEPIRGLYIWGGVGRGKTYLMDLFHDLLPFAEKRRLHFHRFMRHVHDDLRALAGRRNPLTLVAERFAAQTRVLCFDEFHVSDIGDAMILGELLAKLLEHGITLVATSNTAPQRLYEDGLQRRRFLPAIDLIERHTEVVHIGGDIDYRLRVLRRNDVYRTDGNVEALLESFQALCHTSPAENEDLIINDRPIRARYCAGDVAWFDFEAVCDGPRSPNDYIELARLFSTVTIHGVPILDASMENQARRFISLIDEFYDRNVKMLLAAAAPIDEIYRGERLTVEFERTRSRVNEMQSDAYLRRKHRP